MTKTPALEIRLPPGGFDRAAALGAVRTSGLTEALSRLAPGPFGLRPVSVGILEAMVEAADLGLAAAAGLEGVMRGEEVDLSRLSLAPLSSEQGLLVAAFQLVVGVDRVLAHLEPLTGKAASEGMLELEGLESLLSETDRRALAVRMLRLVRSYLELHAARVSGPSPERVAAEVLGEALALLRNTVVLWARSGRLAPLVAALAARPVSIEGQVYRGLERQAPAESSGLLPVGPDQIVGNVAYLEAGLRLARDVAAFDLRAGRGPKRLNPILFGLGAPGCGKTVTAHAIGNYFLDYCGQRGVPARFVVVRRSDWASSYQNASAANLIRIFREEVHAFPGVCGVYWPDIDTALASRASSDLRAEEKQNLAAVFGVFDGTLLPKDGKWFLICDANTLHMDEAAISRIAQNPFTVEGPSTAGDYVRLMRDLLLGDLSPFLPGEPQAWERIGAQLLAGGLSGRTVEAIANNIRARVQDFEYPDAYFAAGSDERERLLAQLGRSVDEAFVLGEVESWRRFRAEAERRDEEARFEREVADVVRQLNAGRKAALRAAEEAS